MLSSQAALFFIALLTLAIAFDSLAQKLRVPNCILLIVLGFVSSELLTRVFDFDTGIRWQSFQFVILHVFLPIIIFQSALKLNIRIILKDFIPLFLLSLPLMLIAVLITATVLFYGIDFPEFFSWHTALICGALLSATDSSSVVQILKQMKAPKRLITLLESESLLNDATAVVLFTFLLSVTTIFGESDNWQSIGTSFIEVFSGGIAIGVLTGLGGCLILSRFKTEFATTTVSILAAYGAYILASDILQFSGVMAVLSAALTLSKIPRLDGEPRVDDFTQNFWQFAAQLTDNMVYLLAGISITLIMFREQWLTMLLAIVSVLIARSIITLILLPLICRLFPISAIPFRQLLILNWGGTRGTVTMALALSLPLSLDAWFSVQSAAYGVILFSLFFQSGSIAYLTEKLQLS
ncbi:MAG: hypothetical protein GKR93_13935 [Gammaproteobacteria bacterium]|nr:hypothetical protein [Gammaproteobacteria bacterium]